MTRPAARLALAGLAALIAFGACQSSDVSPRPGYPDPVPPPANDPRIAISQADLQASLGFDAPVVTRRNELLTVSVPVRSLGNERYILDYRFTWYDEEGFELKPLMSWREIVLEPRGSRRLQANALDERAEEWKLEVRWANR